MCAMEDGRSVRGASLEIISAKRKRLELKQSYNSPIGEAQWQKIIDRGNHPKDSTITELMV